MDFTPALQHATLIQRYKRFLADVVTPEGETLTLHCPNTGAMTGCATPGDTVWYSTSENTKRKYPHTWEITQTQNGAFICVNTQRANQLAKEAILSETIPALTGYSSLKSEVKSVTLAEKEYGYFPDAVTLRGQKHLRELMGVVAAGDRAVLLFTVLHSAIEYFAPAHHIDAQYAQLLAEAHKRGVEILAYKAELSADNITLRSPLPVTLPRV